MNSKNSQSLPHPKYRPDIDGLRAIAVLSVVIFHAFPNLLKGGFIGVDIFFVISGFLISTIIISGLKNDSFSFIEFYSRRIKRIYPALLLVLISSFIFGWFALLADEYKQLGKHIAGGAGFISNFILWEESGYFNNTAETKPLLHLWSLGIEEQFYIVWPLLLWITWKQRLNILTLTQIVMIISFILNVNTMQNDSTAAFYSPQTRFWELLMGSILAYATINSVKKKFDNVLDIYIDPIIYAQLPEINNGTRRNLQSLLGAAFIIIGIVVINKESFFPGWWALLPTIGTVLIISAGVQAWFNRAVLSSRLLVWFGLISFPLYLWHWPLLSFARIIECQKPTQGIRFAALTIAIVLAWLTYKFIEKPIRFENYSKEKTIALFVLMLTFGFTGYYGYKQNGFDFRFEQVERNNTQFKVLPEMLSQINCTNKYGLQYQHCMIDNVKNQPEIMLIGDSHSNHLYPAIANKFGNILNLAGGGCLPFFNTESIQKGERDVCANIINSALKIAIDNDSVRTVILASRGSLYLTGKGYGEAFDRILTLTNRPEISDFHEIFKIGMKDTIDKLLAKHKKVIFILDNPELGFNPQSCIDTRPLRLTNKVRVRVPCAVSRQDFDERNREYRELVFSVLKDFPAVHILDVAEAFCDDKWCWAMKDGKMLYRDDDHLSLQGSELVGQKLVPLIKPSL